jgi:hypothetical protein
MNHQRLPALGTNEPQLPEARTVPWRRAFRPLFVWLAVSALLLAYDAHLRLLRRTRLVFAVAVAARYDWLREQREVHARHSVTSRVDLRPDLGSLALAADLADAALKLVSPTRPELAVEGRNPDKVRHLPARDYHLRVWPGGYLKELTVASKHGETNSVRVPFEYGQVQLVSEPAGAAAYEGDQQIGQTPKILPELKPGRFRFRMEQAGYEPVQVSFAVRGTETLTMRTNLVNIRYQVAMQQARRLAGGTSPDYRAALASVAEALDAQLSDAEATELKTRVEAQLAEELARMTGAQRQAEVAKRRQAAPALFQQVAAQLADAALFDTHSWTVRSDLATVCEALRRTFETGPEHRWTVERQTPENEGRVIF